MHIAIAGMSGFIGGALQKAFLTHGYSVFGISRGDLNSDSLQKKLDGCDVIINLAGAPIIARWSDAYKKILRDSRIITTQKLANAINGMQTPPSLFISTSAIGIYKNDAIYDESTSSYADDFLADLCQEWESVAKSVNAQRVAITRFGVVISKDGGALSQMLPIFKLGLGGVIGSGEQPFSWIHIDDLANAFLHIIQKDTAHGTYNFTAPTPTTNKEFTKSLGAILNRPTILPVPEFALKIIYGDGARVLTDGQSVLPAHFLSDGFAFKHNTIREALEAELRS